MSPPATSATRVGRAVVAVGGNSISKEGQVGTIPEQFENARETARFLARMIELGWDLVLTHGNGPQVGNVVLRVELASNIVYPLPLDICDSDTEGGMGYMFQQVIGNELRAHGVERPVATMITQVVVARGDPAFARPTKPIGPFYKKEEAELRTAGRGWAMVEDAGRGWRRVVPSPRPLEIVELEAIRRAVEAGIVVIAAGGGGIPVVRENGDLRGVEAVIDKDRTSALLAIGLGADLFLISTGVERVALDYRKPGERPLDRVPVAEARRLLALGQFPPGSMGPKIEAACTFVEATGGEAVITNPENIERALAGKAGTRVVKEE